MTTVPESDLRQAAVHAASMVRSVERLAWEHGANEDNYEMYESKGQVVVVLHGIFRFRQCNVCNGWNSNKQRWCDGCRKRTYCGRHCQKADWPAHKPNCIRALSEATVASSPATVALPATEDTIQAIASVREPCLRHVGYDDRGWVILDAVSRCPGVNICLPSP